MNKSISLIRFFLFSFIALFIFSLQTQAENLSSNSNEHRIFQAGAAISNITPPLDEPVVGGWNSPPAAHVHDELYAKCLVLDNGKTKLVFVVCDSLGISREVYDKAKQIINKKTGIQPENMMMSATHTHSSISARSSNLLKQNNKLSDYQQFLVMRIADGVRRALNNMEPARTSFGCANEPTQVFNRRYFMKPGVPTPNPFGGTDKRSFCRNRGALRPGLDDNIRPRRK